MAAHWGVAMARFLARNGVSGYDEGSDRLLWFLEAAAEWDPWLSGASPLRTEEAEAILAANGWIRARVVRLGFEQLLEQQRWSYARYRQMEAVKHLLSRLLKEPLPFTAEDFDSVVHILGRAARDRRISDNLPLKQFFKHIFPHARLHGISEDMRFDLARIHEWCLSHPGGQNDDLAALISGIVEAPCQP